MKFNKEDFQNFKFSENEINQYYQNMLRDLNIAREDDFPEVRFTYSYQALIKCGITLIAKVGQVKVRSILGHHKRILEKLSEILHDREILDIGNAMRTKRNLDFYSGGEMITEKEADEYLEFVERIFNKVKKLISTG